MIHWGTSSGGSPTTKMLWHSLACVGDSIGLLNNPLKLRIMKTIKIQGVYTPEASNFFVDSIAKYVRDNNYPDWHHQLCDIITSEGIAYNYMISRDDNFVDNILSMIDRFPEKYWTSSGVTYRVDNRDFEMLIDGHYYWATA